MKKILLFTFLILLLSVIPLIAIDWPSSAGVIIRNFGHNNAGLPHLGISFASTETIEAAGAGELLFHQRRGDTASRLPSTLGSWLAVDHGDGIISIYSRFRDETPSEENMTAFRAGQINSGMYLGESGISGWSSRNGFYFQLYDRTERRWLNPALIIPPPLDTRMPDILSTRLVDSDANVFFNPSAVRSLSQGRYTVIVDTFDTMRSANENPLAPFRIICLLNGREAGALDFISFSARDGSLIVQRNGLIPVRQVYSQFPAYEIADIWLNRGQANLEIIVQDIMGNRRNIIYRFLVE